MHAFADLVPRFEERFSASLPFPESPATIYEPCRYFLQLGGKRIRPVLCLMANELFDEINEDAWYGAFGIELFHNFTLIHDDIMEKRKVVKKLYSKCPIPCIFINLIKKLISHQAQDRADTLASKLQKIPAWFIYGGWRFWERQ